MIPTYLSDPAGQRNHMLNGPAEQKVHDSETCEYRDCEICEQEKLERIEIALTDKGNEILGKGFNHDLAMSAILDEKDEPLTIINWDANTARAMGYAPINMAEKIEIGID